MTRERSSTFIVTSRKAHAQKYPCGSIDLDREKDLRSPLPLMSPRVRFAWHHLGSVTSFREWAGREFDEEFFMFRS